MVQELLLGLDDEDGNKRLKALNEISDYINKGNKIEAVEFVDKIIILLDDENDFVRIKATEISEHYTDEKIVDKLMTKLINDENTFVRGFAAKALGSIGNIKAKSALESAMTDKEGFVISFVTQSLKTINMKASFSSKLNMLKAKMNAVKQNVDANSC